PDAAVFDALGAAACMNDRPDLEPKPFDKSRDGLVVGEGACTLILEDLQHAVARGAKIFAEVVGFGTNADGTHVTNPNPDTMARCLELALEDAGISPSEIGYVNAHGTSTVTGDIAESDATYKVFGRPVPISSTKGYIGHTLGACGGLEAWLSINMMNCSWFHPTPNLTCPDPRCAPLGYITGEGLEADAEYVMSNNFAFGGINSSLIFRRYKD
ncbi:MAG: beta-ketoacyl-ACP synthase, partial [Treponema sp.]|nr:beta-ketoacyl-ACP synthase [Treponema sp.]